MSQACSLSVKKPYGLSRVCRLWRIPRSTYYEQSRHDLNSPGNCRRRGPKGPLSDSRLTEEIRTVIQESHFHSEGYRKVWARLRFKKIYTSKRRVLRLMRENDLLAVHRQGRARGPKAHDGKIVTSRVNTVWGTDLTTTMTVKEGRASIFFAVDHCSCECVGIHAAKYGTRFEALEPLRQGVKDHFGVFCKDAATGLSLRHDHGSQFISHDFQSELQFLGITSSPAYVREPQGNGCAERFVRTLKENLLWLQSFETVEELREALIDFRKNYNENWIIERHGYKTPSQVREEQSQSTLQAA